MSTSSANLGGMTQQSPADEVRPRLVYLDNLRTVLITAVVLGHLAGSYGLEADWMYREGGEVYPAAQAFGLLAMVLGVSFAMGLFFFLAGYFTPPAFDRRGIWRFVGDRFWRLGIPWVAYEVLINPLVHYSVDVHGGNCKGALYDCQFKGTLWQYLRAFPHASGSIGDGPVWFLEALLFFVILYALWRALVSPTPPAAPDRAVRDRIVPGNMAIVLFALVIGLSTFVLRFWVKAFVQYEPLHLEFGRFPQYIALFVAGTWAYPRNWLTLFSDQQGRAWRRVAVGCVLATPVLAVAAGAWSGNPNATITGGVNWLSFAFSLWEGFLSVSMVISILTWFRRRFNHQGQIVRIMSESAFAVYVLHPAVIVPLALAFSGIQMNLNLKFLFVAPIAIVLCYQVAHWLRKLPFLRTVLR